MLFRTVLGIRPVVHRSVAATLAVATAALGLLASAAVQLVALIAVVAVALLVERRQPGGAARPPTATPGG